MAKIVPILAAITERIGLLDHSGELVKWLEPEEARGYLLRGEVVAVRTKRKVRALKLIADYSDCGQPARRSGSSPGIPHTHETYFNPPRVFTFDRVPPSIRPLFTAVVKDCLAA